MGNSDMYSLTNKVILIISPQSWGTMFISKHHYAVELARNGNQVYFLNPPDTDNGKGADVNIAATPSYDNLYQITHSLGFPFILKFHALPIFHLLIKPHVKTIIKKIGRPVDIVWSFDLNYLYPFRFFPPGALKIFHPVDEPLTKPAIEAAKGADIIFSVTREILAKYDRFPVPKHLINHGVAEIFIRKSEKPYTPTSPLQVGFSGNLLRNDIDRAVFLEIIRQNPNIQFNCWGSYSMEQANVSGNSDDATMSFIRSLQNEKNVKLYGAVKPERLSDAIEAMDAFLICYDVQKDQSKGTNYHKILEYLGTGKIVISNNVTAYDRHPELVQMVKERDSNNELPALFAQILQNIGQLNAEPCRQTRVSFAANNTYQKQISRIEAHLSELKSNRTTIKNVLS